MTLISNQVVQATCPGCKNSLRIPGSWIGQSMKCKHCGMVFQAKLPDKGKKKKKRDLLARAARATKLVISKAMSRRKRKKKRPDAPQAKPYTPPPAIPLGKAPPQGAPPAAIPLPTAIPVNAGQAKGALPAAIPIGSGSASPLANLHYDAPRRRRSSWKGKVVALLFFVAVGGIASAIYTFVQNNDLELGHGYGLLTATDSQDNRPANNSEVITPQTKAAVPTSAKTPPSTIPAVRPPTQATPPPVQNNPPPVQNNPPPVQNNPPPVQITRNPGASLLPPLDPNRASFPRRLMAVVPVNYAFTTPIGAGSGGPRSIDLVVRQLGELLRVPSEQIVLLSDRAADPKPPIKDVITTNVSRFLASCREQDRIIVMFVGHGVEVNDKPYLVPLEGEPDKPDNLIPLEWFYQELGKCKARQKIFVVDVCRFDPVRGEERGAVAKMGEKFDAALQAPPAGVQVLTACVAGQYSYEATARDTPDGEFEGGIMLAQVPQIRQRGGLRGIIQRPEDSIPIDALSKTLAARTGAFARAFMKAEQTVRLTGSEKESKLIYDPRLAAHPRFELQLAGIFTEGVATRADIESLLSDVAGLPPTKRSDSNATLDFDSLPPYPAKNLAAYKPDNNNSPLREKIREAIELLKTDGNVNLQEMFNAPADINNMQQANQFKQMIENIQKSPAVALLQFRLESFLDELDGMEAERAKETKRWQANFNYVRARLAAKLAYVAEYNYQLGQIRKDFPPYDPAIHRGWQLAAKGKLEDREAAKFAKKAAAYLDQLAKENAGTPWELIAKRDKVTSLGLEWKPAPK